MSLSLPAPVQAQIDDLYTASMSHSQAITALSSAIEALCATRDALLSEVAQLKERVAELELATLPFSNQ